MELSTSQSSAAQLLYPRLISDLPICVLLANSHLSQSFTIHRTSFTIHRTLFTIRQASSISIFGSCTILHPQTYQHLLEMIVYLVRVLFCLKKASF